MSTDVAPAMQVVEIAAPGGPEALRLARRPTPAPAAGEVLLRVVAAGVNWPDVLQRMGRYPPPPGVTDVPGLEAAGEVVAVAPSVAWPRPGDRVCALLAGGGYAEFAAVPAVQCLPVPDGVTVAAAAAMPETFFTVWGNVFERGRLRAGESILVHGGAGGIGTTAIQMARAFGARVLATAGGAAKCAACARLGAQRPIDHRTEDFVAVVRESTGGRGVDVILDMVGGDYVARNFEALAEDGRLVQIAFLRGGRVEVDLMQLMRKRITLTGSTLRGRPAAEKGRLAAALREHVWPLVAAGAVRPVIDRVLPLAQVADAHRLLEARGHIGKVVLAVAPA